MGPGNVFINGKTWELIKTHGKITPIVTILFVLLFTFLRDNQKIPTLITSMMAVLTLYYFMSATVHPWYIIFLVVLGVFTRYKYAVLWSATVVLSYYAYSQADFKENLTLITVEYISVYVFLIYEIFNSKEQFVIFRKN